MIVLRFIPVSLSVLLIAAHYFRNGDMGMVVFWLISPYILLYRHRWSLRVFQLILLLAAGVWLTTIYSVAQLRIEMGEPYTRMAVILGAVAAIAILSAIVLNTKKMIAKLAINDEYTGESLSTFIITFAILSIVQLKASFPIILAERFMYGLGWLEILLLSFYAGWLTGKMMDIRYTVIWRKRIWLIFSIVFFAQFIVGLTGAEEFLMTGNIHIPVPAVILAGPIYRGGGFFMPILLLSTLLIVGPSWCSYLCYIGSWDHRSSLAKRIPGTLPNWHKFARIAILVVTPIVSIILRMLGVSVSAAATIAIIFGAVGVLVMMLWSRKSGAMAHCITWCPIGLLVNWLGKLSPFRIRINETCNECGACNLACRYLALTITDIQNRRPGLTCTLCGDCLKSCRENSLEYRFIGLKSERARSLFLILIVSIHAIFMGLARI